MCNAMFMNSVPEAENWYTPGVAENLKFTARMKYIVCANVEMLPISDSNKLPNRCDKVDATRQGAVRISDNSLDEILMEIDRSKEFDCVECLDSHSVDAEDDGDVSVYSSSNEE